MQPTLERFPMLLPGAPGRLLLERAVRGSLMMGFLFWAFAWVTKEARPLYMHAPWQNDPYDAVVSFAILFVPLLVGLSMLRVPLCRRQALLPVSRANDLLRACRVLDGVVVITLCAYWASVALRVDRSTWNGTTAVLVGGLVALSVIAGWVCWYLWLAGRAAPEPQGGVFGPDWLSDVVALGERIAGQLGPGRAPAVRLLAWLDHWFLARLRCHPIRAAALFSLIFGGAIAGSQTFEDGLGWITLLFFAVGACGQFAFLTIAGSYLRIAGPRGEASRGVTALVSATASVPIALAFRDVLWTLLGTNASNAGLPQLAVLLLVAAMASGAVAFAAAPLLRARLR